MKYDIITFVPDFGLHTVKLDDSNLLPALEVRGYEFAGINRNKHQRTELQGQPKFKGLNGPMYGGPGIIRYEDPEAYARLSA